VIGHQSAVVHHVTRANFNHNVRIIVSVSVEVMSTFMVGSRAEIRQGWLG